LTLLLAAVVGAQDLVPKAAPQKGPIAVVNCTLHPVDGPTLQKAWILFDKGRIVKIGTGDGAFDDGVDVHDAKGQHVYPGFIAPYTSLGLVEISAVRATVDMREVGELKPEARAAVAVNPDSTLIPVTRSNGVLTFTAFPRGGAIPGRAGIMSTDGWTWEDMAIRADAGLVVNWPNPNPPPLPERARRRGRRPPEERGSKRLERIREAFTAARVYVDATEFEPDTPIDVRWEAMRPVLTGKRPVFFIADDYAQIVSALDFAETWRLKAVIVGGRDAPLCADQLKKRDVPVILRGVHTFPRRNDSDINEIYGLPAQLEKAGVRWCLASGERVANERNLPYTAGRAVAFGLPRAAALEAITLRAATILGVGEELGSLTPGKRATLFVCDGDPLQIPTKVTAAWIDGRRVSLDNKQIALERKYREKLRQKK